MNPDSTAIEDIYPLSPMQRGLLFHSLYTHGKDMYIEQLSCTLRGNLNVFALERAWQFIVDRHPILRTAFVWEDLDEPVQIVYRQRTIFFKRLDWRAFSPQKQLEKLEALEKR